MLLRRAASIAAMAMLLALPAAGAETEVKLKPLVGGFERPLLVSSHEGRARNVFVGEQAGVIHRVAFKRGSWRRAGVFLDISDRVSSPGVGENGENGLLGLALHPDYRSNGLAYVSYTEADIAGTYRLIVSEFERSGPGKADADSEREVLRLDHRSRVHFSGHLDFGPDGRLYIGVGDARLPDRAQDLSILPGSILRIKPTDPDGAGPRTYGIPKGNPHVGKAGKRDEIWASGLRNPWQFSFDRKTDALRIGDVGEGLREEVDRNFPNKRGRAGKGVDYGWNDCEGKKEFADDEGDADRRCEQHRLPVHDYGHNRPEGWCAVTGGSVHRGPGARAWQGLYVAGDLCGGVFVLNQAGKRRYQTDSNLPITSFGEDSAGRIFATTFDGNLNKVVFKGPRP